MAHAERVTAAGTVPAGGRCGQGDSAMVDRKPVAAQLVGTYVERPWNRAAADRV